MTQALTVPLGKMPAEQRGEILDHVIEAYHSKSLKEIAGELKVTPATLTRHLMNERQEQWKSVQFSKALLQAEAAKAELATADDMLKVNRAEKMLKAAQWELERLDRRLYGSNPPDDGMKDNVRIVLNIGIQRPGDQGHQEKEVKGEVLNGGQGKD